MSLQCYGKLRIMLVKITASIMIVLFMKLGDNASRNTHRECTKLCSEKSCPSLLPETVEVPDNAPPLLGLCANYVQIPDVYSSTPKIAHVECL